MKKCTTLSVLVCCLVWVSTAAAAATPPVTPQAVTNITQTTAVLRGTLNPRGTATTYEFDYGPTTALGTLTPARNAGKGAKAVAVHAAITGLTPGETYYYALIATNAVGRSASTVESFKTAGNPPPVPQSGGPLGIAANQVTLTGVVTTDGDPTTYYFQYGLTTGYGLQTAPVTIPASDAPVPVTATVSGLAPETFFHYRLIATHGVVDGGAGIDGSFETLPFPLHAAHFHVRTHRPNSKQHPFTFTTAGRIGNPGAGRTPDSTACNAGIVKLTFRQGRHVVGSGEVTLDPFCKFTSAPTTTLHGLRLAPRSHGHKRHGHKARGHRGPVHLTEELQFMGTPYLGEAKKFKHMTVS